MLLVLFVHILFALCYVRGIQLFLQAFYYEGKAIMSNEEFDNLKEELMWEGSSVVMLSTDSILIMEPLPLRL